MVKMIGSAWWRSADLADEIPRIAESIGEVRGLHDAAEAGSQSAECAIDVAIILSVEVLQKVLP